MASLSSGQSAKDDMTGIKNKESQSAISSVSNEDNNDKTSEDHRLWIGNLDPKLTEFQLLKIIQRFGAIENFDFLFHRTGPNSGLPRGYAFVTFKDAAGAQNCLDNLNGKRVIERTISVRWAHNTSFVYGDEEEKLRKKLPALGMKPETAEVALSKERTISAIEAKLKAMEREKDQNSNFNLASQNNLSASSSKSQVIQNYPYASKSTNYHSYHDSHSSRIRSKPYSRNQGRRRF